MVAEAPALAPPARAHTAHAGVTVIARQEQGVTGTSRYTSSLLRELTRMGACVRLESTMPVRPVRMAAAAGDRFGLDLATFSGHYPLARLPRGERLYHLASQTLATTLLRGAGRQAMVTVHDIIPYLLRRSRRLQPYGHAFHRMFDYAAMRGLTRAAVLVAGSAWTKQTLVRELRVEPARVQVVPLGVELDRFRPGLDQRGVRRKYRLPDAAPLILYVGSEDPRKNVASLLRAVAMIKGEFPDLHLVKAGPAHHEDEHRRLMSLAVELGIGGAVSWLAHVPDEDLPALYAAAGVFAMPSLYEGFGLPVLEALACGTRVVSSNRSALPEVAGADSLLCDPMPAGLAVALAACLRGEDDRGPEDRRRWAERFSWQRTAESMAAIWGLA